MVQEDIDAGRALCATPLPDWVFKGPVAEAGGVHTAQGSWNPTRGGFEARRVLPVMARQRLPEKLLGEAGPDAQTAGTTISQNKSLRVWTLDGEVLIASIQTKMHVLSPEVCSGLIDAVALAEQQYKGLVIGS